MINYLFSKKPKKNNPGSYIRGTNGQSNGLVPMLRVFNDTARYVDQGGGKRKGSFAVYLEPWHADVFDFLNLKKNTGKEEVCCPHHHTAPPPHHHHPHSPVHVICSTPSGFPTCS